MVTVAGATVAAVAQWAAAGPIAGASLDVRLNGVVQHVGLGAVVAASLLAGLAAWGLLALLERRSQRAGRGRPRRTWTITVVAVLVLSLAGPLSSAIGTTSTLSLIGLHLVVAVVLLAGLGRSARG